MGIAQWIAQLIGWQLGGSGTNYNSTIDNIIYTVAAMIVMFSLLFIFDWLVDICRRFFR